MRAQRSVEAAAGRPSPRLLQAFTILFGAVFAGILVYSLNHPGRAPDVVRIPGRPPVAQSPEPLRAMPVVEDKVRRAVVEDFAWRREAFDAVAVASFTLRNQGATAMQGTDLLCTFSDGSGRAIATKRRPFYEALDAGQSVSVKALNVGLVPDRATVLTCAASD